MEQKSTMWKNGVKHGLIVGLVIIIYSILLFVLELNLKNKLNYIAYLILIIGFIFGTKAYRDNELNGTISFGKAFGYSVIILLTSTIITLIYNYLYFTVIDPDIVDKMLAISEEKLIAKGMPDDQIEMALEMSKKFMSPGFITITGFATNMFFGSIIALITSAFVKKEGNPFDTVIEKENKE